MSGFFAWVIGLLAFVPGFGTPPPPAFTGYVDADYVYVAPVTAGVIASFAVTEGQTVTKGQVLFVQTTTQQKALADAAAANASAAKATWQNLTTGGRAQELAAAQAAVSKAKSDLKLAQTTLTRSQTLYASNTITKAQFDRDQTAVEEAQAAVNQAVAQLAVTGLPARDEQQKAAEASYIAAEANAEKAAADLADRTVTAPVAGRIERTYYDQGEVVPAGAPVLSLLPAGALKVKFYVSEVDRMELRIGEAVGVACDGCAAGLTGKVDYLASDPQYTAPIIYSRDERSRLVFLAEARIGEAGGILPGQPVTVSVKP